MLYEYYMDPAIRQQFSTISYSGDGTVTLLNNKKDWTVIANGIPPLINTHPDMEAGWQKLSEQMGLDFETGFSEKDVGAIYYEFNGEGYFMYAADVSKKYHFTISGYVPWHSVAVAFETMYLVMLIVFCLILLVLIMSARTIYKNKENKQLRQETVC